MIPLLFAARGFFAISKKSITIQSQNHSRFLTMQDEAAVFFGIAIVFIGVFLHFQFFVNSFPRFRTLAQIGKLLSVLVIIISHICAILFGMKIF